VYVKRKLFVAEKQSKGESQANPKTKPWHLRQGLGVLATADSSPAVCTLSIIQLESDALFDGSALTSIGHQKAVLPLRYASRLHNSNSLEFAKGARLGMRSARPVVVQLAL
jgi:hypothetical protein